MRKTEQKVMLKDDGTGSAASNIVRLDTYKEIPEPSYPLGKVGRQVYDEWCRTLLSQGLLTLKSKETVEMLALAKQGVATDVEKGKQPSRHNLEALRAARGPCLDRAVGRCQQCGREARRSDQRAGRQHCRAAGRREPRQVR